MKATPISAPDPAVLQDQLELLQQVRKLRRNAKKRYRYAEERVRLGFWDAARLAKAQRECDEAQARVVESSRTITKPHLAI